MEFDELLIGKCELVGELEPVTAGCELFWRRRFFHGFEAGKRMVSTARRDADV